MSQRLQNKGFESAMIQQIIQKLEREGVLNDQKMIHETIQYAIHGKRLGRNGIRFAFKTRAITQTMIEEKLKIYSKEAESDLAEMLGRERWEKLSPIETERKKKRVYDFLVRKGFNYDLSRSVIETIGNEGNEKF